MILYAMAAVMARCHLRRVQHASDLIISRHLRYHSAFITLHEEYRERP
jgi:hypothetical protein